jgi:glycosyltransferase involved in cell wall biosynthesis
VTPSPVRSVAHVLWSGNVGGIERLVCDLAAEQVAQGLEVTVAFARTEGPFVQEVRDRRARVVDLRLSSGSDLRPDRILHGAKALAEVDVLHLHGFNVPLAAIARRARKPIVFTEHGNFSLGRSLGVQGRVKRHLQRRFLQHSIDVLTANSVYSAARLSEIYGISSDSIVVVYNGTAVDGNVGAQKRRPSAVLHTVFVGRLVEFKRVDRAIKAVALARRRDAILLDIFGGGPLEVPLRRLAASVGSGARIKFHGVRADVRAAVANADVLLLPSEQEPFGLAALEGCAQGALPIAFADGGGVLEVLPPDGIVVENVDDLARVLDGLIGSHAISDDARRRRAEWARRRFPISATANRYLELYGKAIQGTR